MTRLQENTIERLALAHGRVCVREGLSIPGSGEFVEATVSDGTFRSSFRIFEDGVARLTQPNYSSAITMGFAYQEA